MKERKKPIFIIKNYAIASFIIMMNRPEKRKIPSWKSKKRVPFLLRKEIVPVDLLPKQEMWKRRRFSVCVVNRLNCFGLTKKVVYENEEFNLLQHALNIEDGYEDLAL